MVCLSVGVVTAVNVAWVRVAYRREKNADKPLPTTLVVLMLLVARRAALARAVVTG